LVRLGQLFIQLRLLLGRLVLLFGLLLGFFHLLQGLLDGLLGRVVGVVVIGVGGEWRGMRARLDRRGRDSGDEHTKREGDRRSDAFSPLHLRTLSPRAEPSPRVSSQPAVNLILLHTVTMSRFADRVALVTGASSGIGRATALRLAQEGGAVVLVALPGDDLDAAAEECRATGSAALVIPTDVADSQQVAAAFEHAETLGPLSAVFSNAGISIVGPATELHDDDWLRQLHVNLSGSFYVVREAARRMIPRGRGAVVLTGSELGLVGQTGYVGYTATKGGVLAMTRAFAAELASHGIRVNSISPGTTETPMLMAEFAAAPDPARERAENESTIPLGRIGQPGDIAAAVAFLLSDEAAYITGANMVVDGGRTSCFTAGTLGMPD
jgi:NAD(P)-dependent dehydrogenase (short-subunit alcohol dehydrogenase family)